MPKENLAFFTRFINEAELTFPIVFDSKNKGEIIGDYQQMPVRFNTRVKILAYFLRYFNLRISKTMLCNLHLKMINGKLFGIMGDIPPGPFKVVSLRFLKNTPNCKVIRAVLSGDPEGNKVIFYQFRRNPVTCKLQIVFRTRNPNNVQYEPCPRKNLRKK